MNGEQSSKSSLKLPLLILDLDETLIRERCTWRRSPETQQEYWLKNLRKVKRLGYDLDRVLMVDEEAHKLERNYGNHTAVAENSEEPELTSQVLQYQNVTRSTWEIRRGSTVVSPPPRRRGAGCPRKAEDQRGMFATQAMPISCAPHRGSPYAVSPSSRCRRKAMAYWFGSGQMPFDIHRFDAYHRRRELKAALV
jgi:hypothetical protein